MSGVFGVFNSGEFGLLAVVYVILVSGFIYMVNHGAGRV